MSTGHILRKVLSYLGAAAVVISAEQREARPLRAEHVVKAYQQIKADPNKAPDARARKRLRL